MLDDRKKSLIRALLYPVQFERDAEAGVGRAFERVVVAGALNGSAEEYSNAIDAALSSDDSLSSLIPQSRNEKVVRSYLASMQKAINKAPVHS